MYLHMSTTGKLAITVHMAHFQNPSATLLVMTGFSADNILYTANTSSLFPSPTLYTSQEHVRYEYIVYLRFCHFLMP